MKNFKGKAQVSPPLSCMHRDIQYAPMFLMTRWLVPLKSITPSLYVRPRHTCRADCCHHQRAGEPLGTVKGMNGTQEIEKKVWRGTYHEATEYSWNPRNLQLVAECPPRENPNIRPCIREEDHDRSGKTCISTAMQLIVWSLANVYFHKTVQRESPEKNWNWEENSIVDCYHLTVLHVKRYAESAFDREHQNLLICADGTT